MPSRLFRNMKLKIFSQHGPEVWPFRLRIAVLAVGYGVALFGALSVFSFPFYVMLISFVAGIMLCASVRLQPPTLTRRSQFVLFAGMLVVYGVLCVFGNERVRQWRPHPAGYMPAWTVCFFAFRHFWHLLSQREHVTTKNA